MKTTLTLKINTLTKPNLLKALKKDFKISDWAQDVFDKMEVGKKQDIDLKIVSVKDLGFTDVTSLRDIYAKAKEQGYDFCPPEVGPALRLAYKDQPKNEWVVVAMKPITDSGGDLSVFRVARDDYGRWLLAYYGYPSHVYSADDRFVFVVSKFRRKLLSKQNTMHSGKWLKMKL